MSLILVLAGITLGVKALAAIHGTVAAGLERHLRGLATCVAYYVKHLTLSTSATILAAAICAAVGATAGFVLKAFLSIESLFRS